MIEKSPLPFFAKERNWPDIIFQRWGKKSLQNCLKSLFKKKTLFSFVDLLRDDAMTARKPR
jgi:hypothetical protein